MSQKISERSLMLLGEIAGTEKIPVGIDGDPAITPSLLEQWFMQQFADDFWPLSGTAELATPGLTLDGNNFDLIFGSPNALNEFQVYANSGFVLNDNDGIDNANFGFSGAGGFQFIATQNFDVDVEGDSTWSAHQFLITAEDSIEFVADDGVDTSTISLTPTATDIITDEFTVNGMFSLNPQTPASFNADQNNFTPTIGTVYRLSALTSTRNITGWAPQASTPMIWCLNVGSIDIVFQHQNAGSDAENRFVVPGGGDITLGPGEAIIWCYDSTDLRWKLFSYTG